MSFSREPEPVPAGEFRPAPRALVAAVVAVMAVYVYFLIFAQFGFLQALKEATGQTEAQLKPVLAVMGAGGIVASVLAAWGYRIATARRWLAGSLVVAAGAAALAARAQGVPAFLVAAALTGLGLGGATVTLATAIGRVTGPRRLGLVLGAGTGLAYAFCNLPVVFLATPAAQAGVAVAAALVGAVAAGGFSLRTGLAEEPMADAGGRGRAAWVVVFLALVWLDSAAFYVIQHNPELRGGLWAGDVRLLANAGLHLGAALLAGWLLDRGRVPAVVLGAALLLAAACGLLRVGGVGPGGIAGFYVAGVSLYSTALVYYPARSGRPAVAALVYAVAGWTGSALGIGMVENFQAVPGWFPPLALGAVGLALAMRRGMNKN